MTILNGKEQESRCLAFLLFYYSVSPIFINQDGETFCFVHPGGAVNCFAHICSAVGTVFIGLSATGSAEVADILVRAEEVRLSNPVCRSHTHATS